MNQLQDLLTNFESVLDQSIGKTWEAKNLPVNLEVMASELNGQVWQNPL